MHDAACFHVHGAIGREGTKQLSEFRLAPLAVRAVLDLFCRLCFFSHDTPGPSLLLCDATPPIQHYPR